MSTTTSSAKKPRSASQFGEGSKRSITYKTRRTPQRWRSGLVGHSIGWPLCDAMYQYLRAGTASAGNSPLNVAAKPKMALSSRVNSGGLLGSHRNRRGIGKKPKSRVPPG